jgi:hypothetical protein
VYLPPNEISHAGGKTVNREAEMKWPSRVGYSVLGVIRQIFQSMKHLNYLPCAIYCLLALTSGHCGQLVNDGNNLGALLRVNAGWHGGSNSIENWNRSVKCREPVTWTLAPYHFCPQIHNNFPKAAPPISGGCILSLPVSGGCLVSGSLVSLRFAAFGEEMHNKPADNIDDGDNNNSDSGPIQWSGLRWWHWLILYVVSFLCGTGE